MAAGVSNGTEHPIHRTNDGGDQKKCQQHFYGDRKYLAEFRPRWGGCIGCLRLLGRWFHEKLPPETEVLCAEHKERINSFPWRQLCGQGKLLLQATRCSRPRFAGFGISVSYFSIPCWATAILSRLEFLTIYIISSAWRMISCELLASSG